MKALFTAENRMDSRAIPRHGRASVAPCSVGSAVVHVGIGTGTSKAAQKARPPQRLPEALRCLCRHATRLQMPRLPVGAFRLQGVVREPGIN